MRFVGCSLVPLLLVTLHGVPSVFAQPTRTVTVVGQAYGEGKTPEEARHEALQDARARAAEAAGVHIAAHSTLITVTDQERWFQAYAEWIQSNARGLIVSQQDSVWATFAPGTTIPVYHVKLTAEVVTEQGQHDPGFALDIRVNGESVPMDGKLTTTLKAGDEVVLTALTTRDCYLTVFNVLPNDTVTVLAPGEFLRETFVQAERPFQLPPEPLRQQGFHLRAELLPGQRDSAEMYLVVATKTRIPFRGATGQTTLNTINRWLMDIPLDQRTGASVFYRIVR